LVTGKLTLKKNQPLPGFECVPWSAGGKYFPWEIFPKPAPKRLVTFLCSLLLSFSTVCAQGLLDTAKPTPKELENEKFFQSAFKEAQEGQPKAMGIVGLLYEKGLGCKTSLPEALKWLKRGARKGDADSQNNLGFLYFNGLGVGEDDAQALKWFKKAADQGLASAQGNLGLIYARGTGAPKDYARALDWFKKAADQNDGEAQVNLAQMLSLGEGGPKDYVESHKWFSLALRHHSLEDGKVSELRNDIEWLEKRMTGSQAAEAHKRASAWKPLLEKPAPPE
jgi:TPR repeat protein